MSKYVQLPECIAIESRQELIQALKALGLKQDQDFFHAKTSRKIMLEGSLECAGEPVDLRICREVLGNVEDFGFVIKNQELQLICGELDQKVLNEAILVPLKKHLIHSRLESRAETEQSLEVEDQIKGSQRIRLRN